MHLSFGAMMFLLQLYRDLRRHHLEIVICVCVYIYIYIYIYIYTYTYICEYIHVYIHTRSRMHACMHACMHAYVHADRHIVNVNPNLGQHWIFGLHHFSQPLKLHQGGCLVLCRAGAGLELQPSSRTPCTPLGFKWHRRGVPLVRILST